MLLCRYVASVNQALETHETLLIQRKRNWPDWLCWQIILLRRQPKAPKSAYVLVKSILCLEIFWRSEGKEYLMKAVETEKRKGIKCRCVTFHSIKTQEFYSFIVALTNYRLNRTSNGWHVRKSATGVVNRNGTSNTSFAMCKLNHIVPE